MIFALLAALTMQSEWPADFKEAAARSKAQGRTLVIDVGNPG